MVISDYMDVCLPESSKNPVKMTRTKFTHSSFKDGEYIRLFENSSDGLVFKDNILLGLWNMHNE